MSGPGFVAQHRLDACRRIGTPLTLAAARAGLASAEAAATAAATPSAGDGAASSGNAALSPRQRWCLTPSILLIQVPSTPPASAAPAPATAARTIGREGGRTPDRRNADGRMFGGGWDMVLPAEWAMPFWRALIYAGARPLGL